jgi:RHS repeat-associated protein
MENGRGDRFRYDDEGQLVEAWYNANDPANSGTGNTRYDGFAYDALGNRTQNNYVASRGLTSFVRRDNGLNQYSNWTPSIIYHDDNSPWPGYNAFPGNGVTMADGWLVASYNAVNQPVAMVPFGWSDAVYFGYDPLGRCVKRWIGTSGDVYSNPATYFHYDGWNLLQEGNNAWGPARVYVHGNRVDEIVWSYNTFTGEQAFHHYDARGHATLLTDSSSNILEQYEYDAFGQPYFYDANGNSIGAFDAQGRWAGYSLFGNRFLYMGREWLSDVKLYDLRNRMYQPELGRFLQPDPKEFGAGDYNLYRYCHNDPVNRNDPTGLDTDFGTVPQPILSLGIEAATQSLMLTRATGDGLERGIVGLQNRADPSKLSLAPPNVGVGIPYAGPQTTETGTPRLGLGEKMVIIGHDHPKESNLSPADKAAADHAKIPVVMTSDGKTFQVYVPHITPSGQVLNRDGVTEIVTKEGVHVFTQQSGKLTPTR